MTFSIESSNFSAHPFLVESNKTIAVAPSDSPGVPPALDDHRYRAKTLPVWLWTFPLVWTALIAMALWWNMAHVQTTIHNLARVAAQASFEKDLVYRHWASLHGGVYVPVTAQTPPNPYLTNITERDITTPSGRPLTLMNPAYMTRQVHELAQAQYHHRGHITSLKPIRPANAPDDWERLALEAFDRGALEISSIEVIAGEKHLRFMRPMKTVASCLKCHAVQGYKEGEIRGGISVAIPLKDYAGSVRTHQRGEMLAHGVVWFLGLATFGGGARQILRRRRERDQAETALQLSREQLMTIINSVDGIVWEADANTFRFTFVSPRAERLLGYPVSRWTEEPNFWADHVHPEDRDHAVRYCVTCTREKRDHEFEYRMLTADGRALWLRDIVTVVMANDRPVKLCGIMVDITERKQVEASLQLTQFSIEHASDALFWITPAACLVDVNDAACRSLGYTRDELLKLSVPDVDVHFDAEKWPQHFVDLKRHGSLKFESEQRAKDGRIFPVEIVANYVQFGGQERNCAFVRDITERKRAEAEKTKLETQLHQTQKIESVGRLAGGVAHDFNNMLQAILGNVSLALEEIPANSPAHDSLKEIQICAQRSADLTRQLLAFARRQAITPKVLDLNETVEGMLKMLRRLIGEDIGLAWLPATGLGPVMMDPAQINQILANLCVNARDAVNGVGKVTIETQNEIFDEAYCADHPGVVAGEFVRLAVSDNGCGMDKATLAQIFEPFFTTKGVGEGTGLGLATVYGIVKQNNGFIQVYSEPGQGTTFNIYLPRHTSQPTAIPVEQSSNLPASSGETLLLVEDEPAILAIALRILRRLGYTVLTASGPSEALRIAGEHTGKIHLLMTDVVMPEMNGRDLAKQLTTLQPQLKCLFMSGYTADVIARHGVLDGGVHFIQKPFSIEDLAAKIRLTLDQQA